MLPAAGVTLPLLSQSIILFQIALSYLVLKKNLEREQVGTSSPAVLPLTVSVCSCCSVKNGHHSHFRVPQQSKNICFYATSAWCMQIVGALIVAAGVCLAAAPSDAGANIFQQVCVCMSV